MIPLGLDITEDSLAYAVLGGSVGSQDDNLWAKPYDGTDSLGQQQPPEPQQGEKEEEEVMGRARAMRCTSVPVTDRKYTRVRCTGSASIQACHHEVSQGYQTCSSHCKTWRFVRRRGDQDWLLCELGSLQLPCLHCMTLWCCNSIPRSCAICLDGLNSDAAKLKVCQHTVSYQINSSPG